MQYNLRGLLPTSTTYTVPSGVEATPNVSYTYDSLGNRLTMTDGMGTANYTYDTVSRLTQESRTLAGLTGSFALNYEYYQSTGQIKKITDPFNDSISYAYDLAGRTTNVTGSTYGGVTNYATNISYRAWDGTKGLNSATALSYDSSMRVTRYLGEGIDANYNYYADSQLYTVVNSNNHLLDRSFNYYDPKGRMSYTSANGVTTANQYYQNMTFTELGHLANRNGRYWWDATGTTFNSTSSYINNKLVSGGEGAQSVVTNYDVQGNLVNSTQGTNQTASIYYDSVGRATREGGTTQTKFYDGNGKVVKDFINSEGGNKYFLWSSVLRDVVTTLDSSGAKSDTAVYVKGQLVAKQQTIQGTQVVKFFKRDPHNTIDMTDSDIKWVDPLNVTGKAATSSYISQYQAGIYGHPDPSYFTNNTGTLYPGGSGDLVPGQTQICKYNGGTISCDKLKFKISNGEAKVDSVPAAGPLTDSMIKSGHTVGGLGYSAALTRSNNDVKTTFPNDSQVKAGGSDDYWWDITVNLPGGQTLQDPPVLPKVKLPPLDTRSPQQRCDDRLASLFGGDGSVGDTTSARANDTGEYLGWSGEYNDIGVRVRNGGSHVKAPDLIKAEIGAFVPYHSQMRVSGIHYDEGLPFFKVSYPSFENYSGPSKTQKGFTLNIFHVKDPIMSNGKLAPDTSTTNGAGSVRIGDIGGIGGERPGRHIHITATNGSTRISMRAIFCQGMGADTWREGR